MLTKPKPNPPFFPAARPGKAAKSGYSTIQRLMVFNGVLTDGAGGSAQTLKSNRFRPSLSMRGLWDSSVVTVLFTPPMG